MFRRRSGFVVATLASTVLPAGVRATPVSYHHRTLQSDMRLMASTTTTGDREAPSAASKVGGLAARGAAAASHAASVSGDAVRAATGSLDAIDMLVKQHREATSLFEKIETSTDPESQHRLLETLCDNLTIHMRIEEEIFYPAARSFANFVEHGTKEHREARAVIAQILPVEPKDSRFKDLLRKLKNMIEHHVAEEEKSFFPQLRTSMDDARLKKLGEEMHKRHGELAKEEKPRKFCVNESHRPA